MELLKVMTFNVRVNTPNDGINSFDNRKERVIDTIFAEKPDLIGFQEATDMMSEYIKDAIESEYYYVGTGREANRTGEGAKIAYNKKKFELLSLETKWLSETPDVPASRFSSDQSPCPRVYTMIELIDRKTRKIVRFLNTHLDHTGNNAKLCGAVQIISRIKSANTVLPCLNIITGDFNARPDSETIKTFNAHFTNLTENIGPTFHGFGKRDPEQRPQIDYIYSDGVASKKAYAVKDEPSDGVYISDHYPVVAYIEF